MKSNKFLTRLNKNDEEYSIKIFEYSLPKPVEALFTVPANWFGLPPTLLMGPLWMGVLLDESPHRNWRLVGTTFFLTAPFLFLWARMLSRENGDRFILKIFLAREGFLFLPISTVLCYWLIEDPELFSLAVYPTWIFPPLMISVLLGKDWARRKRPCTKKKFEACIQKKKFPLFPRLLARSGSDGSFPSGDAAAAMAFAIPIALGGRSEVGGILMFLVCTGRVYFLAHHVFDTIAGACLTLLVHFIMCELLGFGVLDITWKHMALLLGSFAVFMATAGKSLQRR